MARIAGVEIGFPRARPPTSPTGTWFDSRMSNSGSLGAAIAAASPASCDRPAPVVPKKRLPPERKSTARQSPPRRRAGTPAPTPGTYRPPIRWTCKESSGRPTRLAALAPLTERRTAVRAVRGAKQTRRASAAGCRVGTISCEGNPVIPPGSTELHAQPFRRARLSPARRKSRKIVRRIAVAQS